MHVDDHVIAFVKNKGKNLTTMAFASCSIIDFQPLRLLKVYKGIFKAC